MPRRKIGADLKEAICKLYEAGDISAETIEKHGIMSRATFFRNLKMYKSGRSLEQRHSTGRKTNADKLKEQEKQEFDTLQPASLQHLQLTLLHDHYNDGGTSKNKTGTASEAGPSKIKKRDRAGTDFDAAVTNGTAGQSEASDSDVTSDHDSGCDLARLDLPKTIRAAQSYWRRVSSDMHASTAVDEHNGDLDSLLSLDDSQYSYRNRGAMFVVQTKEQTPVIVAAIALRSLIWTPQVYQSLGRSYSSRSIDRVCFLSRVHVDPSWRRLGIGQWLVRAAELEASKLGFSHLYTESKILSLELLEFWRKCDLNEFARFDRVARLEKETPSQVKHEKKRALGSSGSERRKKTQHAGLPAGNMPFTAELSDAMQLQTTSDHSGALPNHSLFDMTSVQPLSDTNDLFLMHAASPPNGYARPPQTESLTRRSGFHVVEVDDGVAPSADST